MLFSDTGCSKDLDCKLPPRSLNVVFFLLVDSPAFEFYIPTFRNTVCSISTGGVSRKNNRNEIVGVFIMEEVKVK